MGGGVIDRSFADGEKVVYKVCTQFLFPLLNFSPSGPFSTVFTLNMKKILPVVDCSLSITRFVT